MDKVVTALDQLAASLRRVKELLAWRDLRQQEVRGRIRMVTQMYDPTQGDLIAEAGFFSSVAASLKEWLPKLDGPDGDAAGEQLSRLEREFWKFARA